MKIKTKKGKTNKKKRQNKKTRRYYGGANPQDILNSIENKSNNPTSKTGLGILSFGKIIYEKFFQLLAALLMEYINKLGLILGVDISNPQQVSDKIENIKIILSDPEIREKVKVIVEKILVIMQIALEASEPYVKPLAEKVSKIYTDISGEFGGTTVKIARDVIQTIPGLNVIASLIDLSSNAATTGLNTYNAKLQVEKAIANTLEATSMNFNNLLNERAGLLNRTDESINQLNNPS